MVAHPQFIVLCTLTLNNSRVLRYARVRNGLDVVVNHPIRVHVGLWRTCHSSGILPGASGTSREICRLCLVPLLERSVFERRGLSHEDDSALCLSGSKRTGQSGIMTVIRLITLLVELEVEVLEALCWVSLWTTNCLNAQPNRPQNMTW